MAEHMMLVDLARNDIGAVCQPGSVTVVELMQAKVFSHVIHLASLIQGQLHDQFDALDVLKYAFPAGTLSGAPKVRAMQLIDQLENSRRGLYGGVIFFIDHLGNFDSCIAIRMAVIKDNQAIVRAGAGIVFDSDPATEAAETRHKAQSIIEAINMAEAGIL
jgi:anthranilate synthase component 1